MPAVRSPCRLRRNTLATHYIFDRRYNFQVLRVDASAIPAKVIKHETFRDRADRKFICDSVGKEWSTLVATSTDHPVPGRVPISEPSPALASAAAVDLGPEPGFKGPLEIFSFS